MDSFKQNERLGRGVNIMGYDPVWKNKFMARMKDEHFRLIRGVGFNSVRIALHPFRDGAMGIGEISKGWLEILDWAVEQSLRNGLMTILDFHEFVAMGRDPLGNKDNFLAFWKRIGERYSNHPNEVIFELLNEPNGELTPELWNKLYMEAFNIVRKTNPERTIIVGPAYWNSVDHLDELKLPEEDENIIVTVHYYLPMEFTHQGAKWVGLENKVGVEWKGTAEEKQPIIKDFEKAQTWSKTHGRPIFLGEFGVYDKADMASRVRYLSFIARLAEKMGWSWAYWQFDSDFILYDIPNNRWVEPVLNALIPSGDKPK
jgi:endoglucanase